MTKLTERQKYLAAFLNPTLGKYSLIKNEDVKKAKIRARGRFWHMKNCGAFFAINKRGRRKHFGYKMYFDINGYVIIPETSDSNIAKKLARNWAQGSR